MTCREFVEFLMAYLDGTLLRDQREVFDAHMNECPSCVTYLDTYRVTVDLEKVVCKDPDGPIPDDVPEGLVAAIVAARRQGA